MRRILTLMVHYELFALVLRIDRSELFSPLLGDLLTHTHTRLNVFILCKGQILLKFQLLFSHLHLFLSYSMPSLYSIFKWGFDDNSGSGGSDYWPHLIFSTHHCSAIPFVFKCLLCISKIVDNDKMTNLNNSSVWHETVSKIQINWYFLSVWNFRSFPS